jgi:hypothetical protein
MLQTPFDKDAELTSWSRILDGELGRSAKTAYEAEPARCYHNWAHILRIYWHAEHTFAVPYDPDLDLAILTHDVVYDAQPDKEERSVQWLSAHTDADVTAANAHIRKTITHAPSSDNRMILLDLADFRYPECAAPNLDRIAAESIALYDVTMPQFLSANIAVMAGLDDRIRSGLDCASVTDQYAFQMVLDGIDRSIALAENRLQTLD